MASHFGSQLLTDLPNISKRLLDRVTISNGGNTTNRKPKLDEKYVLYLPTVILRKKHNPAFALACHVANYYNVPLIVLGVLLDDHSLPEHQKQRRTKEVTMTSRRLAFLLEAFSSASQEWSNHGAGVAIRVHGPQSRSPDHLSLSYRAMAVILDEPFVKPFLTFCQKVEKTCKLNSVPCFRVDGSCTVPPASILKKRILKDNNDMVYYAGVPEKAWIWKKQTESKRLDHVKAAVSGAFDAPQLQVRIDRDDFFMKDDKNNKIQLSTFPISWRESESKAPGSRPWTVHELDTLFKAGGIKPWSMNWKGADNSVKPCTQTVGTSMAGLRRWDDFVRIRKGLVYYAKRRTDPMQPHASSRMSCYLNYGIISIFQIVNEVLTAKKANVSGCDKFMEELIKFREHSYAFCFSRGDYDDVSTMPKWALSYINSKKTPHVMFEVQNLENGTTGDDKWNAMQKYLINTGELHNNVRMTWGKSLIEYSIRHESENGDSNSRTKQVLRLLCYLNDRFALDGLSPPSYAGILWCLGWSDKPDSKGGLRRKTASQYKLGPSEFKQAESALLQNISSQHQTSIISSLKLQAETQSQRSKRTNTGPESEPVREEINESSKRKKTLHHFFTKPKKMQK